MKVFVQTQYQGVYEPTQGPEAQDNVSISIITIIIIPMIQINEIKDYLRKEYGDNLLTWVRPRVNLVEKPNSKS